MVQRVYVERRPGFDGEAREVLVELRDTLGLAGLQRVRVVNRYDAEGLSEELFAACVPTVFSEPQTDRAGSELPWAAEPTDEQPTAVFAVEFLPGQFDQRADSASECIQLISQGERPTVRSAKVYALYGELTADEVEAAKHYLINPVESREASLEEHATLQMEFLEPADVERLEGFLELDEAALQAFIDERGLAMDLADILFCQRYFREEGRVPTITEIRMIDTYWSDHCRHTTFGTELDDVTIARTNVAAAYEEYLRMRKDLGREQKPVCLMDMGTIGAKQLKAEGKLRGLDESEEINACTVKVKVDVNGEEQDWLYLFKNETHNHPTEIEPFGGAATCVGGAIRDPLSGRSYVYQAMRVTGAADPRVPVSETIPGKLPQRKLVTTAANGYSSYGNQIGLATGQVNELYHPGYAAKRMEIGAVVGATPADHVRRETPAPNDVVVLLGGRTGRDGIGGATGSSKAHDASSIETCGAEVQKGNAPVERKIQRLFRRGEACRMIKRCNDFGAGGVSVAIGELADSLSIDLDAVPKKYDGLDGTELAISESQERMAVALAPEDVDAFLALAREENLEATPVAVVTDDGRVRMTWRGSTIVDVSREFLASNGAPKHAKAAIGVPRAYEGVEGVKGGAGASSDASARERFERVLTDINVASNKGLAERFDSTIGAASVLMPFGGARQLTPSSAMVAKLPVFGETTTVSGMAWGYNPYLTSDDQFVGAYLAVLESICKLVAAGFARDDMYLTFQEYFERLGDDASRWGKPVAAVLGALMAQMDYEVGAIGGKDSMSGSFEDLDVPPTLVSFATAVGSVDRVTSPEFKRTGSRVIAVKPRYRAVTDATEPNERLLPEAASMRETIAFVEHLIADDDAVAVSTLGYGAAAEALFKMCVGNGIGVRLNDAIGVDRLFCPAYGTFIVELAEGVDASAVSTADGAAFDVIALGETTEAYELVVEGEALDLDDLQEKWESSLEAIFPYRSASCDTQSGAVAEGSHSEARHAFACDAISGTTGTGVAEGVAIRTVPLVTQLTYTAPVGTRAHYAGQPVKPHVVIPVFPGNNCEYDTAAAFEAAGARTTTFIVNNLTPEAVAGSTRELARLIREAQIVMIPGGFSGGDEPDGSAKFITAFFRAPEVTDAVRELLQKNDGLMLGICNGFQALVKLGLVPYGDIRPMDADCATLTFNTIGRHQSRLVNTRVASDLSPWFSHMRVGDIHTVAISHGEGRFVAPPALLDELVNNGQVATQYVDAEGMPSMDLAVNPNGSVLAIEGITSPDGRVLGKMGHSERRGNGLYKNVPGNLWQPLFEGGVDYFA